MSKFHKPLRERLLRGMSERVWEENRPRLKESRNKLLDQGYDSVEIDRYILREFAGAMQNLGANVGANILRGLGVGTAEIGDVGADSATAGKSAARTYIEQKAIGMVVRAFQQDPEKGFGLTLTNALETVLEDVSDEDFLEMVSSTDGCYDVSYQIAVKALKIIEESESERLLKFAVNSIGQELGRDFMTGKLTEPIYINLKEKFSDALSDIIDEETLAKSLSSELCGKFNLDNLLSDLGDYAGDAYDSAMGQFSNAINSLGDMSFDGQKIF